MNKEKLNLKNIFNIFKINILIVLALSIIVPKVFAKPIPPGSGEGDVPANILLMLDTSGSMGWPPAGAVSSYTYKPTDVDVDSNGNVYILEYILNSDFKRHYNK